MSTTVSDRAWRWREYAQKELSRGNTTFARNLADLVAPFADEEMVTIRGEAVDDEMVFETIQKTPEGKTMSYSTPLPPTPDQLSYVTGLQKRLHLPDALLDSHCITTFKKQFAALDRREVSRLLEAMVRWEQLPAELMRAKGQLDLFGDAA
jgi:hypothetical protein